VINGKSIFYCAIPTIVSSTIVGMIFFQIHWSLFFVALLIIDAVYYFFHTYFNDLIVVRRGLISDSVFCVSIVTFQIVFWFLIFRYVM